MWQFGLRKNVIAPVVMRSEDYEILSKRLIDMNVRLEAVIAALNTLDGKFAKLQGRFYSVLKTKETDEETKNAEELNTPWPPIM